MSNAMTETLLLEAKNLRKDYAGRGLGRGKTLNRAVDDVSFTLRPGRTLSIVGESGSGKSTVARMVMRLVEPTAGSIRFEGADWLASRGEALRTARGTVQMQF